MNSLLRRVVYHPLFSGSAVMVLGANLANAVNYLFHLVIGRMLTPAQYGAMSSVFSLIILMGILPSSLSLVVVKYVSSGAASGSIAPVISNLYRKSLWIGGIVLLLCIIFAPAVSGFLNISSPILVILAGLVFLFNLSSILCRSVLQGLLRFHSYALTLLVENVIKLGLSITLVYLGWAVFGAVSGVAIAGLIALVYCSLLIIKYLSVKPSHISALKPLLIYSVPVIFLSVAYTSVFSTDVLLAKHFLSPYQAGLYASLSTLAKIITYGTSPVIAVVFPLVAQRQAKQQNYRRIFWYGLILTALLAGTVLAVYGILPGFTISVLFGTRYVEAAPLLFKFGLVSALFALSGYLVNYHLSLSRVRIVVLPVLAALFQLIGIWFWHSGIAQVINVSFWISLVLLIILLLDYGKICYGKPAPL